MFQQYGRLAGLTTPEERDTLLNLMDERSVMLRPPSEWNQDAVDAQFELYSVMEETGFVESAPSREFGVTYSELQDR